MTTLRSQTAVRGLSLLETVAALLILTLTLWAIQTAYVGLLKGSTKNVVRQKAVVTAEELFLDWKEKAGEDAFWMENTEEGVENGYFYRVTTSALLQDPLSTSSPPETLKIRMLTVRVYYGQSHDTLADLADKTASDEVYYVELQGSVTQ